jgi:hypothetical protein
MHWLILMEKDAITETAKGRHWTLSEMRPAGAAPAGANHPHNELNREYV